MTGFVVVVTFLVVVVVVVVLGVVVIFFVVETVVTFFVVVVDEDETKEAYSRQIHAVLPLYATLPQPFLISVTLIVVPAGITPNLS